MKQTYSCMPTLHPLFEDFWISVSDLYVAVLFNCSTVIGIEQLKLETLIAPSAHISHTW